MKITRPTVSKRLDNIEDLAAVLTTENSLEGSVATDHSLSGVNFASVRLVDCRLENIDMMQACFEKLEATDVIIRKCSLIATVFAGSEWDYISIENSQCVGVQFQDSCLKNVMFDSCKLDMANFRSTKLSKIIFKNCTLNDIDFYNSEMTNVQFENCQINKIQLSKARLNNVDLTSSEVGEIDGISSLRGSKITNAQLIDLAPYLANDLGIMVVD